MKKKIVLLTKSRKHKNYCVAGKDIYTGAWIRLISNDEEIHNAIRRSDLIYDDGTEADILDVVEVDVYPCDKDKYQPENYILNKKNKLIKVGKYNTSHIDKFIEKKDNILFNNMNSITEIDLNKLTNIHSLIFIEANIIKIRVKNENSFTANIKYNGIWYNNLTITDTDFTNKYYFDVLGSEDGINLYNTKIVISLGELFNSRHYKLVASIIENTYEPIRSFVHSY